MALTRISVSSQEALSKVVQQANAAGAAILTGRAPPDSVALEDREYIFIDMSSSRRVLEHEPQDQVISVETGITLGELDEYLKPHGQWFPVSAPPALTLLDVINSGNGGLLEHGFGAVRDLVLGAVVVTGQGIVIKSGGKVVKNVTGYDSTKLFVGSRATLGIAHAAHLRLFARPEKTAGMVFCSDDPVALLKFASALIGTGLPLSCLELIEMPSQYALFVQISGHEDLIKEIVPQLHALKEKNIQDGDLTENAALELLTLCSTPRYPAIELSASISEMTDLLEEWWMQAGKPSLQLRPGNGRVSFFADPKDSRFESLGSYLEAKKSPSTVALASSEFEYKVKCVDENSSTINQIKKSIKDQFDPAGCLNPLVTL